MSERSDDTLRSPRGTATRRRFLAGTGSVALLGGLTLAGCAAPPPEEKKVDPATLVFPPPPEEPRFVWDRSIFSSNDVVEVTGADRFRQFATGQAIRGKGLSKPFGVAADQGRVFVSDTVLRLVHVFDYPRRRYYEIGTEGLGRLLKPLGVAHDAAGRLYVVDATAKRVVIFDLEGNYIGAVGGQDDLSRPSGIAVNADGSRIHVLDTGGVKSTRHRVVVYSPDNEIVQTIGTRGRGPGEFNLPLDCALDAEGNLYVLDTGNFRVQVFSPDGRFQRMFGQAGRYPGMFGHPRGIALDADGIIYVSDPTFGIVHMFANDGTVLMTLGRLEQRPGPGNLLLPAGVATDVDRRVYVVEQFFRKVEVFRPWAVPENTPVGQSVELDLI